MRNNFPVLIITYNRPKHLQLVINQVNKYHTGNLYISIDGPRDDKDYKKNKDIVELLSKKPIQKTITNLRVLDKNLGCKYHMSSAIDWFFSFEDAGIILEDDCLPSKDFFPYCNEMLYKYKGCSKVMSITGMNFQNNKSRGDGSYYFSKFNHCWGWATWRSSWKFNDLELKLWPSVKNSNNWLSLHKDKFERSHWNKVFDELYEKNPSSWAYPWTLSVWSNLGLTVTPNVPLVENIGFDKNATHTKSKNKVLTPKVSELGVIRHPKFIYQDIEADRYVYRTVFGGKQRQFPISIFYGFIKFLKKIKTKL